MGDLSPAAFDVVAAGVYRLKVPLPFALRWVNSYLIEGTNGYTVVDPGLHTEQAITTWTAALLGLGIELRSIEQIMLTHYHPDHYGLAGWLQRNTTAPVYISRTGWQQAELLWGAGETMSEALPELFIRHGLPQEHGIQMQSHMLSFNAFVSPQPEVTILDQTKPVRIGDLLYEQIETAGHAVGHISFYQPQAGWIFSGDHVLPQITPNISYLPGGDEDPLHSFLTGLDRLALLQPSLALPGHKEPFAGYGERIAQLIEHHSVRVEEMHGMLQQPLSAYELCIRMFGSRLSLHQLRFALSETIAHLIYMERRGKAANVGSVERPLYAAL